MTYIFRKLRQRTGQSAIEYALLIVLVLAGVYVMAPFVIRSWNANIKGWDDSVKDSYREPIEPSPPGVLDVSCDSGYGDPCSSPPCCGYGTCEEYERTTAWLTNPIGCADPPGGVTFQCTEDPACCTTPVKLPVPDFCNDPRCPLSTEVPALYSCGGDPDHNNPTRVDCQYDINCDLQCQNPPTLPNPQYEPQGCPQDNINLPNPPPNWTFVEYGKCSAPLGSAPKCQWECSAGFVPGFGASSCECPAGTINLSGVCVIDCTLSEGQCGLRSPAPLPPDPAGCSDLNFNECEALYGALCRWNPTLGCEQERGCDELLTNVTLFYPTEDDDPAFARCEFFPWCQWTGGGGYCCMAVQQNLCAAGVADGSGCGNQEVLACCQFDVTGQCNLNTQSCTLNSECCSNNCVGAGAPGGPFCCLPSQTGACDAASSNAGDCCSGSAQCIGGNCVP